MTKQLKRREAPRSCVPGSTSGFSLLEIVVVLTLTGIIAAFAYPRIDVARYKADAVVTQLRSVIQQAQRSSLVGQHDVIISFDLDGGRIRVVYDANNDHNIGMSERVTWRSLSSGNRFGKPPEGVRGAAQTPVVGATLRTMDNMPTATFHRDGSLSTDLEIYVSTIGSPLRWRAVTVVQATGRTDWFRANTTTGKWIAGVL